MKHVVVDLVAIVVVAALAFAKVVDGSTVIGLISGIVFARYRPPLGSSGGGMQTIASIPRSIFPSRRPRNETE